MLFLPGILLLLEPQQRPNPFQPPAAKLQFAPNRQFDLQHIVVRLDVDPKIRVFTGTSANLVSPLRAGLTELMLHAGEKLQISSVTVDGKAATFRRVGSDIFVKVAPTFVGKAMTITAKYASEKVSGAGFGGGEGGWHWIKSDEKDPTRVGFWTQGESLYNRNWAVTWDYPNDFTTSETYTTVPKEWTVVGNGVMADEAVVGAKKTVHWRMSQKHATYLLSLCGGPFDVKKETWNSKELWYVVPKGMANLIDDSFGDTKDMLTFFSSRFGTMYPWPKYAQNAMYDFGGGMENVSSTTLGMGSLTDKRSGFYTMSSLNSHELGHQWWGDLVSCKDWGHTWLNESGATFSQALYFEHARGKYAYQREIEGDMQGYFAESRRYKRPIATNMYAHPDSMFDSHAYPKGAVVLHTMRNWLGDDAFFAGVKKYFALNGFGPVESSDLCRALTEASGVNMTQFFDQWIYKPGHPVLEYSWNYDPISKSVKVKVDQVQSTEDGTPIYDLKVDILVITNGKLARPQIRFNSKSAELSFNLDSAPDAVILDPDHAFLREMKHTFAAMELSAIAEFAPNCVDRNSALLQYLGDTANESKIKFAERLLRADQGMFPAFETTTKLGGFKSELLRDFFRSELKHRSEIRRRDAVNGLAGLKFQPEDRTAVRALVNGTELYSVVIAAINALDPKLDLEVIRKAATIPSRNERIKRAAEQRLGGI
jgi:aminopeptidase N